MKAWAVPSTAADPESPHPGKGCRKNYNPLSSPCQTKSTCSRQPPALYRNFKRHLDAQQYAQRNSIQWASGVELFLSRLLSAGKLSSGLWLHCTLAARALAVCL